MPGHAGSPHWATAEFDSEGEDNQTPPSNHRVYLDPWDNEGYVAMQPDTTESSQEENFNSFAGEPVSASFYYVPTKNYDSGEEPPIPLPRWKKTLPEEVIPPDYPVYGRKLSRCAVGPEYPPEIAPYAETLMKDRRRSMYIEEPTYVPHPMLYEPLYGFVPPGYMPPPPRARVSLTHPPEYAMAAAGYVNPRRQSRMTDIYEQLAYESLSPDYEDWARPFPKTAPNNFHLSRYGHLQIDYSCSWNSLDRLIRSKHRA